MIFSLLGTTLTFWHGLAFCGRRHCMQWLHLPDICRGAWNSDTAAIHDGAQHRTALMIRIPEFSIYAQVLS